MLVFHTVLCTSSTWTPCVTQWPQVQTESGFAPSNCCLSHILTFVHIISVVISLVWLSFFCPEFSFWSPSFVRQPRMFFWVVPLFPGCLDFSIPGFHFLLLECTLCDFLRKCAQEVAFLFLKCPKVVLLFVLDSLAGCRIPRWKFFF